MHTRRILLLVVLAWTLQCASAQTVSDPYGAAPGNASQPVLLKLNFNYLLFTYPVSPYRDCNGSVMVPLRVIGELMGGQVYTSRARKAGLLIRPTPGESRLLEFTAGSREAFVDENRVELTSAPIWLNEADELLVPLEPLITAFKLRPYWNRQRSV